MIVAVLLVIQIPELSSVQTVESLGERCINHNLAPGSKQDDILKLWDDKAGDWRCPCETPSPFVQILMRGAIPCRQLVEACNSNATFADIWMNETSFRGPGHKHHRMNITCPGHNTTHLQYTEEDVGDMHSYCDVLSQGFLLQVVLPPDVVAIRELMLVIQDAFVAKLIQLKDSLVGSIVHSTSRDMTDMDRSKYALHKGEVLGNLMHAIADIDTSAQFRTSDFPQLALDDLGWQSLFWAGELDESDPCLGGETSVAQCLRDTLHQIYNEYICLECRPWRNSCIQVLAKGFLYRWIERLYVAGGIISLVFAVLLPALVVLFKGAHWVWQHAAQCAEPAQPTEQCAGYAILPQQPEHAVQDAQGASQ